MPPFATDSDEVHALIAYARDSGVPFVVTCTTNHSQHTTSGNISRHVQAGTHGQGLAVDFAGPSGGHDTKELESIWAVFHGASARLYELIFAGHQCIKNGKPYTYPPSVMQGHHNHVHVSVNKGVMLRWDHIPTTREASHMLNKPACKVLPTPTEQGYYIVAEDGGVFSFGDALDGNQFSVAGSPHNAKIVDACLTKSGQGMWLLAADGGIDARGDATFHGSAA